MIAVLRLELVHLLRRMRGRGFLGVVLGVGLFVSMPLISLAFAGEAETLRDLAMGQFALAMFASILPVFGIAASMAPLEALVWSLPVTRRRAMAAHVLFWSIAWSSLSIPVYFGASHGSGLSAGWEVISLALAAGLGTVAATAILMLATVASRGAGSGAGGEIAAAFVRTIGLTMVAFVFSLVMTTIPLQAPLACGILAALLSCSLGPLLRNSSMWEWSGPTGQGRSPKPAPREAETVAIDSLPELSSGGSRTAISLAGALRGGLLRDPLFLLWSAMIVVFPLVTQGGGPVGGAILFPHLMVYLGLGSILQRAMATAKPFLNLPLPREQLLRTLLRLPFLMALLSLALLVAGGVFPYWGNGFHKGTSGGVRLWVEPPRSSWSGYGGWEKARSRYAPVASDSPATVEEKLGRILEAQYGIHPDPAEMRSLVGPDSRASGPCFPSMSSDAYSEAIVRVEQAFRWRIRGVLFLRSFFSALLVVTLVLLYFRGLTAGQGRRLLWLMAVSGPVIAALLLQIFWRQDGGLPGPTTMALDRFLRSRGWILCVAWIPGLWVLWRSCVRAFARMEVTDFSRDKVLT